MSLSIRNQILTERDSNYSIICRRLFQVFVSRTLIQTIHKSIQLSNWPGSVGARREVTWCMRALSLSSLIAHYCFFNYWLLLSGHVGETRHLSGQTLKAGLRLSHADGQRTWTATGHLIVPALSRRRACMGEPLYYTCCECN